MPVPAGPGRGAFAVLVLRCRRGSDDADGELWAGVLRSAHWKKIWCTNPLERLNKEVKRRTDVVGVFPTPKSCSGWPARSWSKAHDEWQTSDRRYLSEATMALLTTPPTAEEVPPRTDDGMI